MLDYLLHLGYNKINSLCFGGLNMSGAEKDMRFSDYLSNAYHHFLTITRHKQLVMHYCFKAGLYKQGLLHDLSKYSPAEFMVGVKYYTGMRSPNSIEREKLGYSAAWLHHKGRNLHHFEYWIDNRPDGDRNMAGVKMPVKYVVEMFCDRIAACRVYLGDYYTNASPYEYYERSHIQYMIHPETDKLLKRLLIILRDNGEEKVFAYIRARVLKNQAPAASGSR